MKRETLQQAIKSESVAQKKGKWLNVDLIRGLEKVRVVAEKRGNCGEAQFGRLAAAPIRLMGVI